MSHFGVPHTVNHAASGALRRNGKAAMSRIDRSKSRSAGGKGFYIALALCLVRRQLKLEKPCSNW